MTATAAKYDAALAERDAVEGERAAVRLFIAELRSTLLADEITRLVAEGEGLWVEQDAAKQEQRALSEEREALIEQRAKAGGDRIGELERLAREARRQAAERREARTRLDAAVSDARLEPIIGPVDFAALRSAVGQERPKLTEAKRDLDGDAAEAIAREKDSERRRDLIAEELAQSRAAHEQPARGAG